MLSKVPRSQVITKMLNTDWIISISLNIFCDFLKSLIYLFYSSFSSVSIINDITICITRVRDKDCVKNRVKRAKIVRFTLC